LPPRAPGACPADDLAFLNLIGDSPVFREVVRLIRRLAACDETTLIEGETGTGKDVAARAIHYFGARRRAPFIPINCGALPDALLESELFGHERGAFTDARERRSGLVAEADGGTLFLDEVEAMSPRAQVVLLRFLQDQKYRPVGSGVVSTANVRIIAASNADLSELADRSLFRRDLLFRLSVLRIHLPPLRERIGDAELLARTFLERFSTIYDIPPKRLHPASIRWLEQHDFVGNVRELESLALRAFLLTDGEEIVLPGPLPSSGARHAPGEDRATTPLDLPFKQAKAEAVAQFEETYLRHMLAKTSGNISLAARLSNKDRSALNRLVKKYGLATDEFRAGRLLPAAGDGIK
jgi:DNA-binding NtrC family response regulator